MASNIFTLLAQFSKIVSCFPTLITLLLSISICETCKHKPKTFLSLIWCPIRVRKNNGVLPLQMKDIRDLGYHLKFLILQGYATIVQDVAISEAVWTV